jgi:glycosyltransferase involved in cell wall biosynthesis
MPTSEMSPRAPVGAAGLRPAPRATVMLAVLNGMPTVLDTIASVRAQTLADWELVVVDDGSTDGTSDALARAAAEDPRIVVLRNDRRRGTGFSLNRAAGAATAPLVAVLDADDIAHPTRLERQVSFLDAHPDVHVLGSGAELVDEAGTPLPATRPPEQHSELAARRFRQVPVLHPSVMMRREVLGRLGGYDTRLKRAQDHDLWLRAFRAGLRFHNLPEPLIRYRVRRKPTLRATAFVAFVVARGAIREGRVLHAAWYALMHLAVGVLVGSGLYEPRWLRSPAARNA